jgi:hypothetical protein
MSRTRTEGSSTVFPAAWRDDDFWVGPGPRGSISGLGTGSQALRDSAFDAHTRLPGLLCTSWSPHRSWIGRELFRSGSRPLAACSVRALGSSTALLMKIIFRELALHSGALSEGGR